MTYEDAYLSWSASLEGASAILVASFPVMPRLYQFLRGENPKKGSAVRTSSHMGTFGSGPSSNRRSIQSGFFGKNSNKTPQTAQVNIDESRLRRADWVPIKDAQEYGLSSAQVTLSEVGEDRELDLPNRDIRKTIRIETRFEISEPRSAFED